MLGKRKRDTVVVRRKLAISDAVDVFSTRHPRDEAGSGAKWRDGHKHANEHQDDKDHGDRSPGQNSDANSIFRKYFESHFDPIDNSHSNILSLDQREESDNMTDEDEEGLPGDLSDNSESGRDGRKQVYEQDDFTGFSDTEVSEVPIVEVIEDTANYTVAGRGQANMAGEEKGADTIDKIFKKSFMTSKPPRDMANTSGKQQSTEKHNTTGDNDDDNDTSNLKNDLDLQRLLRESHLLSQSRTKSDTTTTTLQGRQRHQAADLRLMDLGSRSSIFAQEKMPMTHRKGIRSKASMMDDRRRREAKENGIILERPGSKNSSSHRDSIRRDRGVDVPVLGKFKGGTLSLSKKDIANIQGPTVRAGRGAMRGGRGRKRGRG